MKSEIKKYLAKIGRKGGQTTGPTKARATASKAGKASAEARRMKKLESDR